MCRTAKNSVSSLFSISDGAAKRGTRNPAAAALLNGASCIQLQGKLQCTIFLCWLVGAPALYKVIRRLYEKCFGRRFEGTVELRQGRAKCKRTGVVLEDGFIGYFAAQLRRFAVAFSGRRSDLPPHLWASRR